MFHQVTTTDLPTGTMDLPAGWGKATHKDRLSGERTFTTVQRGRVNKSRPSSAGPLAKMIKFNQAFIGHRPNRDKRLGTGVTANWRTILFAKDRTRAAVWSTTNPTNMPNTKCVSQIARLADWHLVRVAKDAFKCHMYLLKSDRQKGLYMNGHLCICITVT